MEWQPLEFLLYIIAIPIVAGVGVGKFLVWKYGKLFEKWAKKEVC